MTISDALPYVAALATMVSGVAGFFWAKSGERAQIGGVGWALLALSGVSGTVAVWQTWDKGQRDAAGRVAAEAAADAARMEADAARSRHAVAVSLIELGGSKLLRDAPVGDASFYFAIPFAGEKQVAIDGFVGPFPALAPGATAQLRLRLGSVYRDNFELERVAANAVSIRRAGGKGPVAVLEPSEMGFEFRHQRGAESMERWWWWASPEIADTTEALEDTETQSDSDMIYGLGVPTNGTFRILLSALARQEDYGQLVVNGPPLSAADLERTIKGFEKIQPYFAFTAPLQPRPDGSCAIGYLRVYMKLRLASPRGTMPVVFKLQPASSGFKTEEDCDAGIGP